ncbi:MAG: response regulator [Desulfobacterales bacterium]|nr:response regulator [Desulfobacterales bacterium]
MKILVIDDEEIVRYLLNRTLTTSGYQVIEACDGIQGLSLAKENLPNLIILDLLMPNMDGFEVLENLKSNNATNSIPVIIFSCMEIREKQHIEISKKANLLLSKVTPPNEIIDKVKEVLNANRI